ncbi:MAG: hypothetical protein KF760_13175 [Candidatus Eremiobacteraeota bacterium]|nr:hypothetical protein [Candidatus Eremiobacteraeota bacterium]MCW5867019.1 hypothetical protein [Candidatus Eremiobacteraeota bacterium]
MGVGGGLDSALVLALLVRAAAQPNSPLQRSEVYTPWGPPADSRGSGKLAGEFELQTQPKLPFGKVR